uniref:Uncharacterized protein n=1 Tax=Arundo donax TaxID=35708 RepID=A0A0A9BGC8_ARUDO
MHSPLVDSSSQINNAASNNKI